MIDTVILFACFEVFQAILVTYMQRSLSADMWDLAELDITLWRGGAISGFAKLFNLANRVGGIAFLIYLGFCTRWFYPIILYGVTLPTSAILTVIVQRTLGLRTPSLLGFIVIPIVAVWMWLSV